MIDEKKQLVWVATIMDRHAETGKPWVYVADTKEHLIQDIRRNYAEVAPREGESDEEYIKRIEDSDWGTPVAIESYYVEDGT